MSIIFFGDNISWINLINQNLINYPKSKKILNCDSIVICQNYNEQQFKNAKYVIPLFEHNIIILKNNGIKSNIPDADTVNTFKSKIKFHQYCINNNLKSLVPKTFSNLDDIKNDQTINKIIIKKDVSGWGVGCEIIDKNEIKQEYFNGNNIQEYLPGKIEYVSHIIAKNGKIVLCITYETITNEEYYIKNSNYKCVKINSIKLNKSYINQLENFLIPCAYNGICCFDYKIVDNQIKVFEINPRIGGSLLGNIKDFLKVLSTCISLI